TNLYRVRWAKADRWIVSGVAWQASLPAIPGDASLAGTVTDDDRVVITSDGKSWAYPAFDTEPRLKAAPGLASAKDLRIDQDTRCRKLTDQAGITWFDPVTNPAQDGEVFCVGVVDTTEAGLPFGRRQTVVMFSLPTARLESPTERDKISLREVAFSGPPVERIRLALDERSADYGTM